ncbi:MAG TPA: DUF979 domain-containing protein [Opitutus sp.]|nr:DUF979 domain-containing protein [Opitutus sp.]
MTVKLITLETFYLLIGLVFALVAGGCALDRSHPRRWGSAIFWGLLAIVFGFGKYLPALASGYLVLALVLLAATKQVGPARERPIDRPARAAEAARLGNHLIWPAVLIPVAAVLGTLALKHVHLGGFWFVDPAQVTLISVAFGALLALSAAQKLTGAGRMEPSREGGRLLQTIGWALILPQLLAALGGVFGTTGVGEVVAGLVQRGLPTQFPFVAVAAYCVGMALFTMCMGNAFAAFAVITSGIGLPLIVHQHGGNPAIMASIGMLSGYCGTLMTPMAANFNLVPALLLELPDRNAVVKAQVPIGVVILAANVALMYLCVFRF